MTMESPNQREFTRVPVHVRAEIMAEGRSIPCTEVLSLSMKGALIQTQTRLPEGLECEITLSLLAHEVEIQILGTVVRNYPDGIAFQFTKIMGPESFAHLRNLVLYNAQDVDQVELEFETHSGIRKKDPEQG